MSNLTFGDDTFGYYETIAGGSGAGPELVGASDVQTHMTNTRITDPEVLEDRFDVRLWRFRLRVGSGGSGANPGGEGVVRELEALRPLTFRMLSQRPGTAPFGLDRGGAGASGRTVHLKNGVRTELPAQATVQLAAGDDVRVETPGGGGWGA